MSSPYEELKIRCPFEPSCPHQMVVRFNAHAFGVESVDFADILENVRGACVHVPEATAIIEARALLSLATHRAGALFDALLSEAEKEIDALGEGLEVLEGVN